MPGSRQPSSRPAAARSQANFAFGLLTCSAVQFSARFVVPALAGCLKRWPATRQPAEAGTTNHAELPDTVYCTLILPGMKPRHGVERAAQVQFTRCVTPSSSPTREIMAVLDFRQGHRRRDGQDAGERQRLVFLVLALGMVMVLIGWARDPGVWRGLDRLMGGGAKPPAGAGDNHPAAAEHKDLPPDTFLMPKEHKAAAGGRARHKAATGDGVLSAATLPRLGRRRPLLRPAPRRRPHPAGRGRDAVAGDVPAADVP